MYNEIQELGRTFSDSVSISKLKCLRGTKNPFLCHTLEDVKALRVLNCVYVMLYPACTGET